MGHMTLIPPEEQKQETALAYYIPYISVLRRDAVTTKLRNVFNASSPSSNGVTLNDQIHAGPKLQTHIFDIITRIKQFKFIYSSDVTKMYRQIMIKAEDKNKLRIIWRSTKERPLNEYFLNTITYGLDCAPWQAIRTLHQIADDNAPDEETKFIIKKGFYMDDLFYGADTVEECQVQIHKIITTLESGKLPLTKWISNNESVLTHIEENKKLSSYIDQIKAVKTLGLMFYPGEDMFGYKIKEPEKIKFTKRGLLSVAASLYDPIGWIIPVIVKFRLLIQTLWFNELGWDDKIDHTTKTAFEKCLNNLNLLNEIKIPRWLHTTENTVLELIGFCDASKDAYAAVIYSRIFEASGIVVTIKILFK